MFGAHPSWVSLLSSMRSASVDDPRSIRDHIAADPLEWERWYSPYTSGSHRWLPLPYMMMNDMFQCAEYFLTEYLIPRGQHKEWCNVFNWISVGPVECVVLRRYSPVWLDVLWRCGVFNPLLRRQICVPSISEQSIERLNQLEHIVDATIAMAWTCTRGIPDRTWEDMALIVGERMIHTDVGAWSKQYHRKRDEN